MNTDISTEDREATFSVDSANVHHIVASVWDGHQDQDYRKDISHWRGFGRWKDTEVWKKMGEKNLFEIRLLLHHIEILFFNKIKPPEMSRKYNALEWGPGGGSNLLAMSAIAKKLYAVDVSKNNLDESGRVLEEIKYDSYRPILLSDSIQSALECIDEPLDIVLSTAVFQHFPSGEYGLEVLRGLSAKMKRGGAGIIQIRYDNGNPNFIPKSIQSYEKNHITATSYPLDVFWNELLSAGFQPLFIKDINNSVNYASFCFYKR